MTRAHLGLLAACVALALAGACDYDDAPVSPLSRDAGADASLPRPDAGDAEAEAPLRTIIERSPFGDVAARDNLLWDGDFEWETAFADSSGWVGAGPLFVPIGTFSQLRIGAACRSGMKCGYLAPSQRVGAIGVAPPGDAPVYASVWVKPPTGNCFDVGVVLFGCSDRSDPDLTLLTDDGAPDADGWCAFRAVGGARRRATCLLVEARFADGEALVDDAVVRAASPEERVFRRALAPQPVDRRAADAMRAVMKRVMVPREPPPNAAERAFEAWRRRPR
ncbi:MAG: hypothetical protein OZ921_14435 [Sorangiineae bacterium]|nr:hypothetical protein [Sorangiineae bacterium]MEB2343300.1 hypothetical protein [Deltaproteobacteria bacterium]